MLEIGTFRVFARSFWRNTVMPNIEIHGIDSKMAREPHGLYEQIRTLLKGVKYCDDVVVSIMGDLVLDLDGQAQPFLRLILTHTDDIHTILNDLRRLPGHSDIEVLYLHKFIPRENPMMSW